MVMITNSFDKFPNEPTGLMYEQFGKIGLNPSTITMEDDFSSDNWTDVGSNGVTGGHLQLNPFLNNSDNTTYRAITALSDTKFVMRFSFTPVYTGHSSGSSSQIVWFGLASGTGNSASTQDWVILGIEGWSTAEMKLGGYAINNGTAVSQFPSSSNFMSFTSGTTYYCQITRDGDDFTFNIYSDSAYSTQVGTVTRTVSGITGLDTLVGTNWLVSGSNNATATNEIDDVKIYDGVTSTTSPKVKQHFIEYFSGKQLPSYWDKTVVGSSTGAMSDAVGGGYLITTGTSNDDLVQLDFNDINQFSHNASEVIAVWKGGKSGATFENISVGLMSATYALTGVNQAGWVLDNSISSNTYFMKSGNPSGVQYLWTSVPYDTSYHVFKSSLSASGMTGSIDDVVTGTQTSNLPTGSMQPHIHRQYKSDDFVARIFNIRYMECFNT